MVLEPSAQAQRLVRYTLSMKHIIVYSHGFGVDKTDRGLLSDIAATMPDYEHILFDYNDLTEGNLTVSPMDEQVRRLNEQLARLDSGATIDIVAHSQGCVIAALAKPQKVRHVICLTPPGDVHIERIVNRFKDVPGSNIDMAGDSKIVRSDGSTTIIPAAYWESIKSLDVMGLYNQLAKLVEVTFITANQDDVLSPTDFAQFTKGIKIDSLDGDHNFTGEHREAVCARVRELLQ